MPRPKGRGFLFRTFVPKQSAKVFRHCGVEFLLARPKRNQKRSTHVSEFLRFRHGAWCPFSIPQRNEEKNLVFFSPTYQDKPALRQDGGRGLKTTSLCNRQQNENKNGNGNVSKFRVLLRPHNVCNVHLFVALRISEERSDERK